MWVGVTAKCRRMRDMRLSPPVSRRSSATRVDGEDRVPGGDREGLLVAGILTDPVEEDADLGLPPPQVLAEDLRPFGVGHLDSAERRHVVVA